MGNSSAHARFLADVLDREVGLPARYLSTGALASHAGEHARDALVVFSQGLSPNARFALTAPEAWGSLILVTATGDDGGTQPDRVEKAALLASLRSAGAVVHRIPGEDEYGTLVRITGPMLAYTGALAVARALGRVVGADVEALRIGRQRVEAAWDAASAAVEAAFPRTEPLRLGCGITLLASGGYGERAQGWRHKVLEGMGLPWPPLWDLLEFAHGPFQEHADREGELVLLGRADARDEAALLAACGRMLDPRLHRLRVLEAQLPGVHAVFEHEAQGNELLVRWLAEAQRDPRRWAGQHRDAPLYERRPRRAAR